MVEETQKFTRKEYNQIKFFVAFGIFIIAFQFLQYITAKQAAAKYKNLFYKTAEIQRCINKIHAESATIQRFNLNLALADEKPERKKIRSNITISERKIDSLISISENKVINFSLTNNKPIVAFYKQKIHWINYKKISHAFSKLICSKNKPQITFYRTTILRKSFNGLQKELDLLFMEVFENQNSLAQEISHHTETSSFYLLFVGNAVLFILIVFLIYIIFSERKNLRER